MTQRNESFFLKDSPSFNLATGAENRTDLVLTPNPDVNNSPIVSAVLAGTTPLFNALVKILTLNGDPLDHQFTNTNGIAVSKSLPVGTYQAVASAPGFLTSAPVIVNVPLASGAFANFTLTPDPRAALNTIYGLVLDQTTGARIANAIVVLTDSQGQTVSTTETNGDGEYLLCETANGSYLVSAQKTGFALSLPLTITVTGAQIAGTNINLVPQAAVGATVQGFIKDPTGVQLAGACVGLYSVSDSTETLIQTTFTNSNGFYLFGSVAAGNYLVKAKVDIVS